MKNLQQIKSNNLFHRTVNGVLIGRHRVYAGYHRLDHLEIFVHELNDRSRAVRGAGRGGHNHVLLGSVTRVIGSEDEHRRVDRRRGDNNSLRAAVDVQLQKLHAYVMRNCH